MFSKNLLSINIAILLSVLKYNLVIEQDKTIPYMARKNLQSKARESRQRIIRSLHDVITVNK